MTTNIIEIYERLYDASDNIKGETIEYNRGFQDAVYVLKLALQKHEHINVHLENKKLKRQLLLTDLNFDDSLFTIDTLRKENTELKTEIARVGKFKAKADLPKEKDVNFCSIEIEGYEIEFFTEASQEQFDTQLVNIIEFVDKQRNKGKRKGMAIGKAKFQCWVMQALQHQGIKCWNKKK